jgi:hypothetical protein
LGVHGTAVGGLGGGRIALPVPSGWRHGGAQPAGAEGRKAVAPEARAPRAAGAPSAPGATGRLAAAYAPDLRFAFGPSLAFEAQRLAQSSPQETLAPPQALAVYQTAEFRTMGFMGRLEPLDWRV